MDYRALATELAAHVRGVVRPLIGRPESRTVTGTASSGDATFSIDDVAEAAVVDYIRSRGLNVAYYTEDAGLRSFGSPECTLIIDPIDGTRGAAAGFECCVVSVAVADYTPNPCMRDVRAGCIHEIKSDRVFVAERGSRTKVYEDGKEVGAHRSNTETLEGAAWSAEFVGRPAVLIAEVLADAIDASGVKGGFFVLNSSAYSLTRLVTGQLSAVVDPGGRLLREVDICGNAFRSAGCGSIIGLFPYDIAAAALIAQEAGCVVTDAYGGSLDGVSLLDSSPANIMSLVATCTPALHAGFMGMIDRGFARMPACRRSA